MSGPVTTRQEVAAGTSWGAALLLITAGIFEILQAISAIGKDNVFIAGIDYVYQLSATTWGWIHLVVGLVVVAVGLALFGGATWARVAAIVVAALTMIVNFMWIPYYPVWSILVIAVSAAIIWAVSTWQPERWR